MEKYELAKKLIDEANTICISGHIRPDGDAVGSMGAMYSFLKDMGKNVTWLLPTKTNRFDFMDEIDEAKLCFDGTCYDLLISLDTSDEKRMNISSDDLNKAKKIIVIDHHKNNSIKGDLKLVDENAPANCEIVYKLIKNLGGKISKKIANYIYLGLMTDTGSFNYERTTSQTYHIAGEMLDQGAEFAKICKNVNDTLSETRMKLIAYVISNMEVYMNGKIRISVVDKDIQDRLNATEDDVDGLVNYLRCIEGTVVSVYIRKIENGMYKFSIRAEEPIDCSVICKMFGGGGHVRAAGFEAYNLEETNQKLIVEIERLLNVENNRNT